MSLIKYTVQKSHRFFLIFTLMVMSMALTQVAQAENWKGQTRFGLIDISVLTGTSLYGTDLNWSLLGAAAYQIEENGFLDDIDDRLWLETQLGPTFFSSGNQSQTGMQHSFHLRWDFSLNETWTFYGLGGLGGYILPSYLGSDFTIHPRFGVGAFFQTKAQVRFRGEFSHEFIALGVSFDI